MGPEPPFKHSPVVLRAYHILDQFEASLAEVYGALRQIEQRGYCNPADWQALRGGLERGQAQVARLATLDDPQDPAAE